TGTEIECVLRCAQRSVRGRPGTRSDSAAGRSAGNGLSRREEARPGGGLHLPTRRSTGSEEHTSELQSLRHLVCRLLLEKNKNDVITLITSRHIDDCGTYPGVVQLSCVIWSQVYAGVYCFNDALIGSNHNLHNIYLVLCL